MKRLHRRWVLIPYTRHQRRYHFTIWIFGSRLALTVSIERQGLPSHIVPLLEAIMMRSAVIGSQDWRHPHVPPQRCAPRRSRANAVRTRVAASDDRQRPATRRVRSPTHARVFVVNSGTPLTTSFTIITWTACVSAWIVGTALSQPSRHDESLALL